MNNEKKNILSEKRKQLQLKLSAQELVKRNIVYHWLDVFEAIKQSGINYQIEYLCVVPEDLHPYIAQAVEDLKHPELKKELVKMRVESIMDLIFEKYPGTQPLKYIPDLPVLSNSDNIKLIFEQADKRIDFGNESVYFFSPDWWPVLKLNWQDIKKNAAELFADIPLPFLFTDKSLQKILFKSLEDEWRISRSL